MCIWKDKFFKHVGISHIGNFNNLNMQICKYDVSLIANMEFAICHIFTLLHSHSIIDYVDLLFERKLR